MLHVGPKSQLVRFSPVLIQTTQIQRLGNLRRLLTINPGIHLELWGKATMMLMDRNQRSDVWLGEPKGSNMKDKKVHSSHSTPILSRPRLGAEATDVKISMSLSWCPQPGVDGDNLL